MGRWDRTGKDEMKKLMTLLVAILFTGSVFADPPCYVDEGYVFHQIVGVYTAKGEKSSFCGYVFKATAKCYKCDTYRVCWSDIEEGGNLFTVSTSDKEGYKYMFWYQDGEKYYFNM